jgi:trigger factor
LKIESQPREDHQVRLIAEFEPEILEKFKHQAARKIAQESKIPGFRPGKAPYEVVKRLYGNDLIEKQAIELLVDDVYPKVLEEAKVKPSGPGSLDEIISTDPPKFAFIVPLEPEVKLGDYRAMRMDYKTQTVSDEEVDKVLKNLQRGYSTAEPVERPARENDVVYLKLSGRLSEAVEGEDPELVKETATQSVIGDDYEGEDEFPYPGFSKELVGLSANDTKSIHYEFPEDAKYEQLRGKKVDFQISVESIKELKLPELNDEFASTLGDYENLEALKSTIRNQLLEDKTREYDRSYTNELVDKIVKEASIEYPPNLLDDEMEEILDSVKHDLEHQKMDLDMYLKARNLERDKFMEDEIKPAAIRRLERTLVLEEISQAEEIKLDRDQLNSAVSATMQNLQNQQNAGKPFKGKQMQNLANMVTIDTANRLLNQKIFDRLKAIASGQLETQQADATGAEKATTAGEKKRSKKTSPSKKAPASKEAAAVKKAATAKKEKPATTAKSSGKTRVSSSKSKTPASTDAS